MSIELENEELNMKDKPIKLINIQISFSTPTWFTEPPENKSEVTVILHFLDDNDKLCVIHLTTASGNFSDRGNDKLNKSCSGIIKDLLFGARNYHLRKENEDEDDYDEDNI